MTKNFYYVNCAVKKVCKLNHVIYLASDSRNYELETLLQLLTFKKLFNEKKILVFKLFKINQKPEMIKGKN